MCVKASFPHRLIENRQRLIIVRLECKQSIDFEWGKLSVGRTCKVLSENTVKERANDLK